MTEQLLLPIPLSFRTPYQEKKDQVTAPARTYVNGLLIFEKTIEQQQKQCPYFPTTIATVDQEDQ